MSRYIEYYSYRDVAQSGSATVWGTGGRKFESCHPDKKESFALSFFISASFPSSVYNAGGSVL